MIADICIHPWDYYVKPFRIAGNLFYVGNSDVSSHLIDTGEGLILLDTAFPQTTYLLLESVRNLGFHPHDIVWIIHCHGHYDHFGGTRAIVELTGAKTALGKEDTFILTSHPELSWAPEYGVAFHEKFNVDRPLSDGDKILLGNTIIDCVHIPGHTPGSMSYFFDISDQGKTYTVGIHGGPGLNTLTDEYLSAYGLSQEARQHYIASLQILKKREIDIFIGAHPGQNDTLGKLSQMRQNKNPFIDKTAWPAFLCELEKNAIEAFK